MTAAYEIESTFPGDVDDDGAPLRWSNVDGWVSAADADRFSEEERARVALPFHGRWILVVGGAR